MIEHSGTTVVTVDGFDVIECVPCGFKHIMPLIAQEELDRFYRTEFYEQEKPEYFISAQEDKEWWAHTYNLYYSLLEKHTAGRRLLDVGSGPGYFLDAGKARGWEVVGIEPSPAAAQYAASRGLAVVNDFFTPARAAELGCFDAIALSLVLEHVPDPRSIIAQAAAMLNPGGVLFVVAPNDFNPLQQLLLAQGGYTPWWVVPRHHLNYFCVESLKALVARQGVPAVEVGVSYPMEFFLLSGRNYVGHPEVGKACHKERKAFEEIFFKHDPQALWEYYRSLASQGIGRDIVLIGKKT